MLLIANHAGNTFPRDGAMLARAPARRRAAALRARHGRVYLPRIPWFNVFMHRGGPVVGTPENCVHLLEREEAMMVFPEGARGFMKPFSQRYQLQRFGLGFLRLALETDTPIVPVGIVGAEEQSPGLADAQGLGRRSARPLSR